MRSPHTACNPSLEMRGCFLFGEQNRITVSVSSAEALLDQPLRSGRTAHSGSIACRPPSFRAVVSSVASSTGVRPPHNCHNGQGLCRITTSSQIMIEFRASSKAWFSVQSGMWLPCTCEQCCSHSRSTHQAGSCVGPVRDTEIQYTACLMLVVASDHTRPYILRFARPRAQPVSRVSC